MNSGTKNQDRSPEVGPAKREKFGTNVGSRAQGENEQPSPTSPS